MAHGIVESKEVVTAVLEIVKVLAVELKNGFEVKDLLAAFEAIQGDEVKKGKIEAALKNIKDVPEEIKDADLKEWIELSVQILAEVPALLEAFKKAA